MSFFKFFGRKDKQAEASSQREDAPAVDPELEKRRLKHSLSISRSGRFKQKKRERGQILDKPELFDFDGFDIDGPVVTNSQNSNNNGSFPSPSPASSTHTTANTTTLRNVSTSSSANPSSSTSTSSPASSSSSNPSSSSTHKSSPNNSLHCRGAKHSMAARNMRIGQSVVT